MDKILIIASPVTRHQQICIYKDNQLIDNLKVDIDDISEVILQAVDKYDIHNATLTGPIAYIERVGELILASAKNATSTYSTIKQQLEIEYL